MAASARVHREIEARPGVEVYVPSVPYRRPPHRIRPTNRSYCSSRHWMILSIPNFPTSRPTLPMLTLSMDRYQNSPTTRKSPRAPLRHSLQQHAGETLPHAMSSQLVLAIIFFLARHLVTLQSCAELEKHRHKHKQIIGHVQYGFHQSISSFISCLSMLGTLVPNSHKGSAH